MKIMLIILLMSFFICCDRKNNTNYSESPKGSLSSKTDTNNFIDSSKQLLSLQTNSLIEDSAALAEVLSFDTTGELFNHIYSDHLGREPRIKYLHLAGRNISKVAPEIGKLTGISLLELSSNPLDTLPKEIGNCTNLKHFELAYTRMKYLPIVITELSNLQFLDISENNFTTLPKEIIKLENIDTLDVTNNHLEIANLAPEVIKWLDKKCPSWRHSQDLEPCPNNRTDFLPGPIDTAQESMPTAMAIMPVGRPKCDVVSNGLRNGHYLALFYRDSTCVIDTVEVAGVIKVYETDNGPDTIRVIKTVRKAGALMILCGFSGLQTGSIKTWYINPRWSKGRDLSCFAVFEKNIEDVPLFHKIDMKELGILKISGKAYSLPSWKVIQWSIRFNNDTLIHFPIIPSYAQLMHFTSANDVILWAGDLDGDNSPDFIMAPFAGECRPLGFVQLFLSSQFQRGHIWKSAAKYIDACAGSGDWSADDPSCGKEYN